MLKDLRSGAFVLVAVFLGSCDDGRRVSTFDAYDLADAAQANARTALAQNEDQESRIDDLERKVRDLQSMNDAISSDLDTLRDAITDNADIFNQHTHSAY